MANQTRDNTKASYAEAVRVAGPEGIDTVTLAARYGVTRSAINTALRGGGECFVRRSSRNAVGVWVHVSYASATEASQAKQYAHKRAPRALCSTAQAIVTDQTRREVVPSEGDFRFTVRALPEGYVSQLDPNECRGWAKAVAK